jgi:DNA invertase Pin-like site-specific DNA recombinase
MKLVAYIRVSTDEQGESGLGIEARRGIIERWAAENGHTIDLWEEEIMSSRKVRPALERALLHAQGPAFDGLVTVELDRIGRSTAEVAGIIEDAVKRGWTLVSLKPNVDMTDHFGRAMAQMACVFAELERAMISARTKQAMAAKRARGERLGAEPSVDPRAVEITRRMHARGMSRRRIAERLEREGIPTVKGGPWNHGTVQRIIRRINEEEAHA